MTSSSDSDTSSGYESAKSDSEDSTHHSYAGSVTSDSGNSSSTATSSEYGSGSSQGYASSYAGSVTSESGNSSSTTTSSEYGSGSNALSTNSSPELGRNLERGITSYEYGSGSSARSTNSSPELGSNLEREIREFFETGEMPERVSHIFLGLRKRFEELVATPGLEGLNAYIAIALAAVSGLLAGLGVLALTLLFSYLLTTLYITALPLSVVMLISSLIMLPVILWVGTKFAAVIYHACEESLLSLAIAFFTSLTLTLPVVLASLYLPVYMVAVMFFIAPMISWFVYARMRIYDIQKQTVGIALEFMDGNEKKKDKNDEVFSVWLAELAKVFSELKSSATSWIIAHSAIAVTIIAAAVIWTLLTSYTPLIFPVMLLCQLGFAYTQPYERLRELNAITGTDEVADLGERVLIPRVMFPGLTVLSLLLSVLTSGIYPMLFIALATAFASGGPFVYYSFINVEEHVWPSNIAYVGGTSVAGGLAAIYVLLSPSGISELLLFLIAATPVIGSAVYSGMRAMDATINLFLPHVDGMLEANTGYSSTQLIHRLTRGKWEEEPLSDEESVDEYYDEAQVQQGIPPDPVRQRQIISLPPNSQHRSRAHFLGKSPHSSPSRNSSGSSSNGRGLEEESGINMSHRGNRARQPFQ